MQDASSSAAKPPLLSPTRLEMKSDTMVRTWNDEIFEIPFSVVNPQNAVDCLQYTGPAVKGYRDYAVSIRMRRDKDSIGFFVQTVVLLLLLLLLLRLFMLF